MTYAVSSALQEAIFDLLRNDAGLAAFAGEAIFDQAPAGPLPDLYVTLGEENVRDASDRSGTGSRHLLTVEVTTDSAGFRRAKQAAGAVCDALQDARPSLTRGRLVTLRFDRATARRRDRGETRQIVLRFHARVADD